MNAQDIEITPELLLDAYAKGLFPMAESANDDSLFWIEPKKRGILPLNTFHVPRRLIRTIRAQKFDIRVNCNFKSVINHCASPARGRRKTWINQTIRELYENLFEMGYCHTVEAYYENQLVGGLYGVALHGVFFGESMFHSARDASKVALVHLIARLKTGGFALFDTQFTTTHLAQFGTIEISKRAYRQYLEEAIKKKEVDFKKIGSHPPIELVLQSISQTSKAGCSSP
ncbi:MAG: leucyl/phenylalanyl-tRNA--protein transferase [Alphaproteobacteria bacterium]|nr:leucyl/phenylalanyl-tRNA--protein transferase [Alphaproteobacteria bacterium]